MATGVFEACSQRVFRLSPNEAQDEFFQGSAFVGPDLVFGSEGFTDFKKGSVGSLPPGEDGCYVHVIQSGNRFQVRTDHSGFKKVFYYWSPEYWVVSNSIPAILEALNGQGITAAPRYSHLASIVAQGPFFQQLYSHRTFADGVRLLPLGYDLSIGDDGFSEIKRPDHARPPTYEDALTKFVDTWVARFETLLENANVRLVADLTGGCDSRAVFALIHAAQRRLGLRRTQFFCSGNGTDFQIGAQICAAHDETMVSKMPENRHKLSGFEAYQTWRHLCLGAYHPVYFPTTLPGLHTIRVGGNGGENHRPFYAKMISPADAPAFFRSRRKRIEPSWLQSEFDEDLRLWSELTDQDDTEDPLIRHYRHFRNRFHSGRVPQSMVGFHPLSSRFLDDVSRVAGGDRVESAQILYDVMNSLVPSVLQMDYDAPEKAPSDSNIAELTTVQIAKVPAPGRIFGQPIDPTDTKQGDTPLSLLREEVGKLQGNSFVKHFFGAEHIEQQLGHLSEAVENRRFGHARDGAFFAAMIAAAEVAPR